MTTTKTDPTWKLFQCGGGARWSSTREDYSGEICNFSGCGCGSIVRMIRKTTDLDDAGQWFRRPIGVFCTRPFAYSMKLAESPLSL